MQIEKKYHFYAAHRNKAAGIKCGRIHGHTYHVVYKLLLPDDNDIAMLFEDIDVLLEPLVKSFDHYLILHEEDSLCAVLHQANESFISVPWITSAENMAKHFYKEGKKLLRDIISVSIQETQSSTVIYEEAISK